MTNRAQDLLAIFAVPQMTLLFPAGEPGGGQLFLVAREGQGVGGGQPGVPLLKAARIGEELNALPGVHPEMVAAGTGVGLLPDHAEGDAAAAGRALFGQLAVLRRLGVGGYLPPFSSSFLGRKRN